MQNQLSPLILTFGPADPVGALGIQSDVAAFSMHGCHGLSVVTGLLVADSARVDDIHPVDSPTVAAQARMLLEDMPIAAIKVGTMATLEQIATIAEIVSDYANLPLILDPFASSLPDCGMRDDDVLTLIHQLLAPQATVMMLSQAELARFADCWRDPASEAPLEDDVTELTALGCRHVLVTGTGGGDGTRINNLYDGEGLVASLPWASTCPVPSSAPAAPCRPRWRRRWRTAYPPPTPCAPPRNTPPGPWSMPAASAWAAWYRTRSIALPAATAEPYPRLP